MPVRVPLISEPAPRVLLDGIVDYAGLFPPAALPITEAVRNYARHRGCEGGWMLGRFVLPIAQFDAFNDVADPLLPRDEGALPWRLAAVGTGDHAADAAAIARLNEQHRWSWDECSAIVDVIETRAPSVDEIPRIHQAFTAATVVYVEIPLSEDLEPFVARLAETGRRAKMRTGGVTADMFPEAERVVAFMQACMNAGVPFKATAGLHHAVRGSYPLTYETDSARGTMFGYLNMFLAAALLMTKAPVEEALELLAETHASSIQFSPDAVSWRSHTFDRHRLAQLREQVMISFGSCSFTEPLTEVRALGAW